MNAHTPAPWIAKQSGEVIDQSGNVVAHVLMFKNLPVVAAAPELLQELQKAHRIILNALAVMSADQKGDWAEANVRDGVIGEGTTRFHERAAAIAKATGGEV